MCTALMAVLMRLPKHPLFLLALVACGDNIIDVGPIQIGGDWAYSESMTATPLGVICNAAGTFTIAQQATTFAGTLTANHHNVCDDLMGGTLTVFPDTQQVTGGQIDGISMSFRTLSCQYTGFLAEEGEERVITTNNMAGTEACIGNIDGESVIFSGSWQASR